MKTGKWGKERMKAKSEDSLEENNLTSSQIEQSIKSYPCFPRLPRTGGKMAKIRKGKNKT